MNQNKRLKRLRRYEWVGIRQDLLRLIHTKGITYLYIAEKVGVCQQSVSDWMAEISIPSPENLKKLRDLLRVNL